MQVQVTPDIYGRHLHSILGIWILLWLVSSASPPCMAFLLQSESHFIWIRFILKKGPLIPIYAVIHSNKIYDLGLSHLGMILLDVQGLVTGF